MFSVNVDKLIKMTDTEQESYSLVTDTLVEMCHKQCKTIGVVGEPRCAFKVAWTLADRGNNVLFVDANTEKSVFLSKYRLGKDLKGFTDYVMGDGKINELVCLTNKDKLNIMFTGEVDDLEMMSKYGKRIMSLLAEALESYDVVVVSSDKEGAVAAYCGGTVLIVKDSECSDEEAVAQGEELENKGCIMLGVIVDEQ